MNELSALNIAIISLQKNAQLKLSEELKNIEQICSNIEITIDAIRLCNFCLEEQSKVKTYIERLTTDFLNAVIGEASLSSGFDKSPFKFILEPVIKDGLCVGFKPMVQEGDVIEALAECGVGVGNVVSFAIRLVFILLNPQLSQIIIGDEMMVNLNDVVWKHLLRFLEDLQKTLPLQLVLITHSGADFPNTIRVYKKGDTSYVEVVK